MAGNWKFYHRYEVASDAFTLYMRHEDHNGRRSLVMPLQMEVITPNSPFKGLPTMGPPPGEWSAEANPAEDIRGFLQAALEMAWELGIRPKGFTDKTDEIAAVRYHLEDMRKLAKVK